MIETERMTRISQLAESDTEDVEGIIELATEAANFLEKFRWCKSIKHGYFDNGWSGILAVFYFEIEPASQDVDEAVWVIVGDIPPAYLDINYCKTGRSALDAYVFAMQEWIDAVDNGESVDDLIPVFLRSSHTRMASTKEAADMLRNRMSFVREKLLPDYGTDTEP